MTHDRAAYFFAHGFTCTATSRANVHIQAIIKSADRREGIHTRIWINCFKLRGWPPKGPRPFENKARARKTRIFADRSRNNDRRKDIWIAGSEIQAKLNAIHDLCPPTLCTLLNRALKGKDAHYFVA